MKSFYSYRHSSASKTLFRWGFRFVLSASILASVGFWTAALLHSQSASSVVVLAFGPQTRSPGASTPIRIRAVEGAFHQTRSLSHGKVKSLIDGVHHFESALGNDAVLSIPASWPSGSFELSAQAGHETVKVTILLPAPIAQGSLSTAERDVDFKVQAWTEELWDAHQGGGVPVYPLHGTARSSLKSRALLLDPQEGVFIEALRPHVISTSLKDGRRLRVSRIRQLFQLDSLEPQNTLKGFVESQEDSKGFIDVFVNGTLRKVLFLSLKKGKNPFSISIAQLGPLQEDSLLTLRLSTSFVQKDAGALAFARLASSSDSLVAWGLDTFRALGGTEKEALFLFLTSKESNLIPEDAATSPPVSESDFVQALLSRVAIGDFSLKMLSPSLQEQQERIEKERRQGVVFRQSIFRIAALLSSMLVLLNVLVEGLKKRQARKAFLKDSKGLDSEEADASILALESRRGVERWFSLVFTVAAFAILAVLDWVLSATASGKLAF